MQTRLMLTLSALLLASHVYAQGNPFCMFGQNDILCQADQLQQQRQQESRGDRSGGITDERIYNPDAGNFVQDRVDDLARRFMQGFDDRYADPYSLEYDQTKDRCTVQPSCNYVAKQQAHVLWLGDQCQQGVDAACRKLRRGIHPDYRGPGIDAFPKIPPGGTPSYSIGGGPSPDGR
jgi:hypothetical protein